MLFSEFQQETGCRDNEHNHKVYRDLEVMYMNDDTITKEQVYEYGRKLVDNSDTPEQVALKAGIKAELDDRKRELKELRELKKQYIASSNECKFYGNNDLYRYYRTLAKSTDDSIKFVKREISGLKFVLGEEVA